MGRKQFTYEVEDPELRAEVKKLNDDSKKNFKLIVAGLIVAVLTLIATVATLFVTVLS